jgi:hypothetical protein
MPQSEWTISELGIHMSPKTHHLVVRSCSAYKICYGPSVLGCTDMFMFDSIWWFLDLRRLWRSVKPKRITMWHWLPFTAIVLLSGGINIAQYLSEQKLLSAQTRLVNSQRESQQKLLALQAE